MKNPIENKWSSWLNEYGQWGRSYNKPYSTGGYVVSSTKMTHVRKVWKVRYKIRKRIVKKNARKNLKSKKCTQERLAWGEKQKLCALTYTWVLIIYLFLFRTRLLGTIYKLVYYKNTQSIAVHREHFIITTESAWERNAAARRRRTHFIEYNEMSYYYYSVDVRKPYKNN